MLFDRIFNMQKSFIAEQLGIDIGIIFQADQSGAPTPADKKYIIGKASEFTPVTTEVDGDQVVHYSDLMFTWDFYGGEAQNWAPKIVALFNSRYTGDNMQINDPDLDVVLVNASNAQNLTGTDHEDQYLPRFQITIAFSVVTVYNIIQGSAEELELGDINLLQR